MLQPCALLQLLAELLRSYSHTATILTEMRHEKRSTIALLIEKYLLEFLDQSDIQMAIKAVLLNFTANPQNHKALDLLVTEIKAALQTVTAASVQTTPDKAKAGETLCSKINALARLVMLIRESPQVRCFFKLQVAFNTLRIPKQIGQRLITEQPTVF